jgi:hypothetical protein
MLDVSSGAAQAARDEQRAASGARSGLQLHNSQWERGVRIQILEVRANPNT